MRASSLRRLAPHAGPGAVAPEPGRHCNHAFSIRSVAGQAGDPALVPDRQAGRVPEYDRFVFRYTQGALKARQQAPSAG